MKTWIIILIAVLVIAAGGFTTWYLTRKKKPAAGTARNGAPKSALPPSRAEVNLDTGQSVRIYEPPGGQTKAAANYRAQKQLEWEAQQAAAKAKII